MNNVCLIGRTCNDMELKRTTNGTSVCAFTLAVTRVIGQEKHTDFVDCIAWAKTAESMCRYITKGRQIGITGRIQTRNWEDKNGQKRKATEVVAEHFYFADSRRSDPEPEFVETEENIEDLPF